MMSDTDAENGLGKDLGSFALFSILESAPGAVAFLSESLSNPTRTGSSYCICPILENVISDTALFLLLSTFPNPARLLLSSSSSSYF